MSLLPSSPAPLSSAPTVCSLPSSVITSLYSKLSSDFSSCLEYNPKFLHHLQDSPSYRPWYHYDLIFCCSPSCLFCFSHTGLLHIPKTWQACTFFWVFVLVVSSTCSAHTPDIHTAYTLILSFFCSNVIFFMKPFFSIYINRIAPSIIFNSCYSSLFFSTIPMKEKETLYMLISCLPLPEWSLLKSKIFGLFNVIFPEQEESLPHSKCSLNIYCLMKILYASFKDLFPRVFPDILQNNKELSSYSGLP